LKRNWPRILKEIANGVYLAVNPILGTKISSKAVGIGAGGHITRKIDNLAEKAIVRYLEKNRISCILIGEECATIKIGEESETYMIVDSIDGTTNAVKGINFASTSIAVSQKDSLKSIEAAIVMRLDNGKAYTAEKGKGAEYNDKKLNPSKVKSLEEAVMAIDISRSPENVERILPLLKIARHIRCLGSAALEICHVASGQLDAYVDVRDKLRTTDIAAAMLILKEAGGVILQPSGEELRDAPLTLVNRFSVIAATNMELVSEILQELEDE